MRVVVLGGHVRMWNWRKGLFAFMSRNTLAVSGIFELPAGQVIEVGLRVGI